MDHQDMHLGDSPILHGSSGMMSDHEAMGGTMEMIESNGFCTGNMGMVMLMEGFEWALKGESGCINLFVPSWTLNTRSKFVAGMVFVTLLAVGTEGISKLRHYLFKKARASNPEEHRKYTVLQTGLHGLHAFVGYVLMLATMTFAWELLLSVVAGLVIGYVVFGGDTYTHVTTNPCCAFLEDEAEEREATSGLLTEPLLASSPSEPVEECCRGNSDSTGFPVVEDQGHCDANTLSA